jgi:hypothetical protein
LRRSRLCRALSPDLAPMDDSLVKSNDARCTCCDYGAASKTTAASRRCVCLTWRCGPRGVDHEKRCHRNLDRLAAAWALGVQFTAGNTLEIRKGNIAMRTGAEPTGCHSFLHMQRRRAASSVAH